MDTNDKKLQEQKAPEKNTDHAFVQVGSDGHPVIPQTGTEAKQEKPGNEAQSDSRGKLNSEL